MVCVSYAWRVSEIFMYCVANFCEPVRILRSWTTELRLVISSNQPETVSRSLGAKLLDALTSARVAGGRSSQVIVQWVVVYACLYARRHEPSSQWPKRWVST